MPYVDSVPGERIDGRNSGLPSYTLDEIERSDRLGTEEIEDVREGGREVGESARDGAGEAKGSCATWLGRRTGMAGSDVKTGVELSLVGVPST